MILLSCSHLVLLTVKGTLKRRSGARNIQLIRGLRRLGIYNGRALRSYSSFAAIGWTGPGRISLTKNVCPQSPGMRARTVFI